MKHREKIFESALICICTILFTICFFSSGSYVYSETNEISDNDLIEAFQNDSTIAEKLDYYQANGYEDDGITITFIEESCNKVGCEQRFLLIQSYIKEKKYRRMVSVLGAIDVSEKGLVTNVTLLNLPIVAKSPIPIEIIEAVPAETPIVIKAVKPLKTSVLSNK